MKLIITSGAAAGSEFEIDREMSLGRAAANDIVLADAGVSSRHATLRPAGDGIEIEDLNSTNGTFVDGRRIAGVNLVRPGQSVRFSTTEANLAPAAGASDTATTAAGPARLIVRSGADRSREAALEEGAEIVIGRAADAGLRLSDPRVSERNTRVRLSGNVLQVTDLGSANGTYVDGRQVVGTVNAPEGADIQVGESVLRFTRQAAGEAELTSMTTIIGRRGSDVSDSVINRRVEEAVARQQKAAGSRNRLLFSGAGILAIAAIGVGAWAMIGDDGGKDLTEAGVVKLVKPSVVRVYSENSSGTGSIIDLKNGYVLTNNHVIAEGQLSVANDITGDKMDARLVGTAVCDDLAVIKVEDLAGVKGLKQMKLGDVSKLEQGQRVVALGYPGAAENFDSLALSATSGIVSKVKAVFETEPSLPRHTNLVQTDTPINHGNSGGPLLTLRGEQIGVNTYGLAGEGKENTNYAVSMERVQQVLPDLLAGKSPKWIGIRTGVLYDDKTGEPFALTVDELFPGSPAQKAGIHAGDVILQLNGQDIFTTQEFCDAMPKDGTVTLSILNVDRGTVDDIEVPVGKN